MGVLFAAFLRAPLTSVFMVLEVSGNYSIILPVLVANTIAYLISRTLQPTPIFEVLTRQDGLILPSMEEQREEEFLRVEDAMRAYSGPTLDTDELAYSALDRASSSTEPLLLARRLPGHWYAFRREQLRSGAATVTVGELLEQTSLPTLFPDTPLETALRTLRGHEILPVVNRADQTKIEGLLTLELILRAFRETSRENSDK
jgi:CIC family chloride channel protein